MQNKSNSHPRIKNAVDREYGRQQGQYYYSRNPDLFTWKLSTHKVDKINLPLDYSQQKETIDIPKLNQLSYSLKDYVINPQEDKKLYFTEQEDIIQKTALQFLPRAFKKTYNNPEHEFINNNQRRNFSVSKYQSSFYNKKLYKPPTEMAAIKQRDIALIKVISSMPKFKMDKLYEMKKEICMNIQNLPSFQNKRFITPKYKYSQGKKNKMKPLVTLSSNQSYVTENEDNLSQKSQSNYRFRTQIETQRTLNERNIMTLKTENQDNTKLIVLTEKSRRNIFRITDSINKKWNQDNTITDEEEMKNIYLLQNKSQNLYQFQNYYHSTYLSKNRGLQLKLSGMVMQKTENFNNKLTEMIYKSSRNITSTYSSQTNSSRNL